MGVANAKGQRIARRRDLRRTTAGNEVDAAKSDILSSC